MVSFNNSIRRFIKYLWDFFLSVVGSLILIIVDLLYFVYDIYRAFLYESGGYDRDSDDEYVNPALDILPLADEYLERKERLVQVYLVVFGLLVSNFYRPSLRSTSVVAYGVEFNIVIFLCSALVYYVFLFRHITDTIRRFLCTLASFMGLSFGFMLIQMFGLDGSSVSTYPLVMVGFVMVLICWSLQI